MKHGQYLEPETFLPDTPIGHSQTQYALFFPNPDQYIIKFPQESEFPDQKPEGLPPSELEAKF